MDSVENGTLFVSGADLIDGTPIIDIKPYIEYCDKPAEESRCANWIGNPPTPPLQVSITQEARNQIENAPRRFLHSPEELEQCIRDVLAGDPRSIYRKKQGEVEFSFPIDAVDVRVKVSLDDSATVINVHQTDFVRDLLKANN